MNELIIFQGASGSGKSTLAKRIGMATYNEGKSYSICSADNFMFEDVDGVSTYVWKPEKLEEAHENCRTSVMVAMEHKIDVIIVDNTNTTQRECEPYLQLALEYGYSVQVVRCTSKFQNIHGVSPEKVEQQRARLEEIKF